MLVRAKIKSSVKVSIYDKKEGHNISKNLSDLTSYAYKPHYFKDIPFGDMKFKANLPLLLIRKTRKILMMKIIGLLLPILNQNLPLNIIKKDLVPLKCFSKLKNQMALI